MLQVSNLINSHTEWLTDRVIHYAHKRDYTQFSSTLREAWRISVIGLSEPLVDLIETAHSKTLPHEAMLDHASEFGVQQGLKHRARGINIVDFVGLMKLYRNAYLDLVVEKSNPDNQREELRNLILELFDAMETGLIKTWQATNSSDRLEELQTLNRSLSNEKNKYLTVFESIAEPAILLDSENKPTHVNVAANRLLLGQMQSGAGYYTEIQSVALSQIVAKLLSARGPSLEPVVLDTPHGARSFDVAIQEMLDVSEKFAGRVIILQDITDYLKAIDAAREADRAKTVFLNTISHEIRTPINSILGLTRLLEEDLAPATNDKLLSIRASGTVLASLIENVLGLSKAENGALQRVDQDFDLDELCSSIAQIVWVHQPSEQSQFKLRIAPEVSRHLNGDMHKLRQVLLNLLSNARKYAGEGEVVLNVTAEGCGAPDRTRLMFKIVDSGPGVPESAVSDLFEPFTQIAQGDKLGLNTGTGLGLAISHRLVSFLGGRLEYLPNPTGGSIFTFAIEMRVLTGKTPSQPSGRKVLVVEDDPLNATVIEGYLSELGNHVVTASSFAQARDVLKNPNFDVVITDFQLGSHTGLDVAQHVKSVGANYGHSIPVIVATAALPQDGLNMLRKSGISRFLEKPFTKAELGSALSGAIAADDTQSETASIQNPIADANLRQIFADLGVQRGCAVADRFFESCPDLVSKLNAALIAGDHSGIAELTHQLTGAAGFVGAIRLVALAKELNQRSKNTDDATSIKQKLHEVETESLRATKALHELVQELSNAPKAGA
ncbi:MULTISPECIES: ATP-binding protein [unclassified Ruegeria]|uniref:ATP-binding protein n=1 Tax=unclassified Ruegeria TaxID=2625375 RepID=UPI001ADB38D8|nr:MULTISPECIES: ATP-binding protein [unclassified Ruegeria]MBO9413432.1 response regulator [Ruegeria sp. R8_1]MBO9417385.1 response regulator [Ruegeria sp. R8_2]